MNYPTVASLKTVEEFRQHLGELKIDLPVDDAILASPKSPMARPIKVGDFTVGNRYCIHPMEGWDGTPDGCPSELTTRRWRNFGISGAKLIWGGEAVAVQHEGRANPRQLCCKPENESELAGLLATLVDAHRERFSDTSDLLVGLQLTHSGRFCRPNGKRLESKIAYHHPQLDAKFGIATDDTACVLTDAELRQLIERFVAAAKIAQRVGFQFVDVKHCHGYLGHELLSGFDRPGEFGGSFANRTRFLREIVAGIRAECPGLMIGVRLSAFDMPPYVPSDDGKTPGHPMPWKGAYLGFGCDRENPLRMDLSEPIKLLRMMRDELHLELVNLTACSPYYNPHVQRPAMFPPSDGYQPPEDPLRSCFRQLDAVRQLHEAVPGLAVVGSGYTYFQEYLPHIAQAVVREGWTDFVGLGRMVLSYPDFPADVLERGQLDRRRLCRTFSECTSAPRSGLVSGCYPLDPFYKARPECKIVKEMRKAK